MTETNLVTLGDLHSHLIPGVDDGASTLENALEGIGSMVREGVGRIITTPHVSGDLIRRSDAFEAEMNHHDRQWNELASAAARQFPNLELRRGAEVKLDVPETDLSDPRVRLGGTSFVLVEWPTFRAPQGSQLMISQVRLTGYRPIIAHVERYYGIRGQLELVEEWRRKGAFVQVSHGSFMGRYGQEAQAAAWRILERGLVDYLSSDFHSEPAGKPWIQEARDLLSKSGAEEQFHILAGTNVCRVFDDEAPIPVLPFTPPSGLFGRLRRIVRDWRD